MVSEEINKKAMKFAKENGYESVQYLGKYEKYFVYEPIMDVNNTSFIGLPTVILINDEEVRMSNYDETMLLLDYDFE